MDFDRRAQALRARALQRLEPAQRNARLLAQSLLGEERRLCAVAANGLEETVDLWNVYETPAERLPWWLRPFRSPSARLSWVLLATAVTGAATHAWQPMSAMFLADGLFIDACSDTEIAVRQFRVSQNAEAASYDPACEAQMKRLRMLYTSGNIANLLFFLLALWGQSVLGDLALGSIGQISFLLGLLMIAQPIRGPIQQNVRTIFYVCGVLLTNAAGGFIIVPSGDVTLFYPGRSQFVNSTIVAATALGSLFTAFCDSAMRYFILGRYQRTLVPNVSNRLTAPAASQHSGKPLTLGSLFVSNAAAPSHRFIRNLVTINTLPLQRYVFVFTVCIALPVALGFLIAIPRPDAVRPVGESDRQSATAAAHNGDYHEVPSPLTRETQGSASSSAVVTLPSAAYTTNNADSSDEERNDATPAGRGRRLRFLAFCLMFASCALQEQFFAAALRDVAGDRLAQLFGFAVPLTSIAYGVAADRLNPAVFGYATITAWGVAYCLTPAATIAPSGTPGASYLPIAGVVVASIATGFNENLDYTFVTSFFEDNYAHLLSVTVFCRGLAAAGTALLSAQDCTRLIWLALIACMPLNFVFQTLSLLRDWKAGVAATLRKPERKQTSGVF